MAHHRYRRLDRLRRCYGMEAAGLGPDDRPQPAPEPDPMPSDLPLGRLRKSVMLLVG